MSDELFTCNICGFVHQSDAQLRDCLDKHTKEFFAGPSQQWKQTIPQSLLDVVAKVYKDLVATPSAPKVPPTIDSIREGLIRTYSGPDLESGPFSPYTTSGFCTDIPLPLLEKNIPLPVLFSWSDEKLNRCLSLLKLPVLYMDHSSIKLSLTDLFLSEEGSNIFSSTSERMQSCQKDGWVIMSVESDEGSPADIEILLFRPLALIPDIVEGLTVVEPSKEPS